MDKIYFCEKKGRLSFFKKFILIGIFMIVLAFFAIFIFAFDSSDSPALTCGDGTFYGDCSLNKPFYCDNGILLPNATKCNCPENFVKKGSFCDNHYFAKSKIVDLNYTLDGETRTIHFVLYEGILDYLSSLPRSISYVNGNAPRRDDFKLMKIGNELQREALLPLVAKIQNLAPNSTVDQTRIAISIVQNIPYGNSKQYVDFSSFSGILNSKIEISRYPYQVLSEYEGNCEDKSELLAFLLKELGYGVAIFYFAQENHEAIGILCPEEQSLKKSGYCFVETTVPSPISYSTGSYLGIQGGRLSSSPQIIPISSGKSLPENLDEYKDSVRLSKALGEVKKNIFDIIFGVGYEKLKLKYGLKF